MTDSAQEISVETTLMVESSTRDLTAEERQVMRDALRASFEKVGRGKVREKKNG